MSSASPAIYISHAWGGESEDIVKSIVKRFAKEGIDITFDKKDLGYRESIQKFMENLGQADAIIIVVSQKYLHSEYCMFELLQIYENKNIMERIFPVVLDEVEIAKSTDRLELVKYWEDETAQLEDKIRELRTLSHIEGITEDLNLYNNIRNNIAKLTSILKDINTLNIKLHKDSDFEELITAINKKLDREPTSEQENSSLKDAIVKKKVQPKKIDKSNFLWLLLLPLFLIAWWSGSFLKKQSFESGELKQVTVDSLENYSELSSKDSSAIKMTSPEAIANETIDTTSNANSGQSPIESNELQIIEKPPSKTGSKTENTNITPTKRNPVSSSRNSKTNSKKTTEIIKKLDEDNDQQIANIPKYIEENLEEPVDPEYKTFEETSPYYEVISIDVPSQNIDGIFNNDISSDKAKEGDVFYLRCLSSVFVGKNLVIGEGARIRARVSTAKSSLTNSKASLGVIFEAVESTNGYWLTLQYPEYMDKRKREIIFKKGTKVPKLRLKSTSTKIKIE